MMKVKEWLLVKRYKITEAKAKQINNEQVMEKTIKELEQEMEECLSLHIRKN